jgi:hypothetical protein
MKHKKEKELKIDVDWGQEFPESMVDTKEWKIILVAQSLGDDLWDIHKRLSRGEEKEFPSWKVLRQFCCALNSILLHDLLHCYLDEMHWGYDPEHTWQPQEEGISWVLERIGLCWTGIVFGCPGADQCQIKHDNCQGLTGWGRTTHTIKKRP